MTQDLICLTASLICSKRNSIPTKSRLPALMPGRHTGRCFWKRAALLERDEDLELKVFARIIKAERYPSALRNLSTSPIGLACFPEIRFINNFGPLFSLSSKPRLSIQSGYWLSPTNPSREKEVAWTQTDAHTCFVQYCSSHRENSRSSTSSSSTKVATRLSSVHGYSSIC